MKEELACVLDELVIGKLAGGRRYEKLAMPGDLFSVRLNQGFRFVFQRLADGSAKPVAVGPHDDAYRAAGRFRPVDPA